MGYLGTIRGHLGLTITVRHKFLKKKLSQKKSNQPDLNTVKTPI